MDLTTHWVVISLYAWKLYLVLRNFTENLTAEEYVIMLICTLKLFSSLTEYVSALESFVNEVSPNKVSLVVQV